MTTFEFANLTQSKRDAAEFTVDMIVNGQFGHTLSSTQIDGAQRLTLKKDGEKIATHDMPRGVIMGLDDARCWAQTASSTPTAGSKAT